MFEALFILTTVDAGTRVARFMLSDGLANLGGPFKKLRNPSWRVGAWVCSIIVVAAWGSILLMGVTDPLGGINTLFPLFGIANQLLAAIALTVVTVVVIKRGLLKWAWIPGIPLLWDLIVTMTASWQKIFSGDPKVGYWTQHFQYRNAKDGGQDDVRRGQERRSARRRHPQHVHPGHAVDRLRRAGGHRGRRRSDRGAQGDSRRAAPAERGRPGAVADLRTVGMIPTAAEKEVQKQWDALPQVHGRPVRSVGTAAHLMGDNHYQRYVDHRARTHPGEPAMSEREYWRQRHAATDANPGARCC